MARRIGDLASRMEDMMLCFVSKWWRPALYILYIASFFINLIMIPLWNWEVPDLSAAATYLAAGVAMKGLRTYEKVKGVARGAD